MKASAISKFSIKTVGLAPSKLKRERKRERIFGTVIHTLGFARETIRGSIKSSDEFYVGVAE